MSDVKSIKCPQGSELTQNDFYCMVGDEIAYPEEYAGEHATTCGSNASAARGVPGFVIDGKQMKCIREGFAAKGIALPKEYFYFDSLSNIEGYACYNTANVVTNIQIVESGMDVVKDCVKDDAKAEAFRKFVDLHTPPESHGTGDWAALFGLFCIGAPVMGILFQHLYQKFFGPKGPPSAPPPTQPGGSTPETSSNDNAVQFSVPEEGFGADYSPNMIPDADINLAPDMEYDVGLDALEPTPAYDLVPENLPGAQPAPKVASEPSFLEKAGRKTVEFLEVDAAAEEALLANRNLAMAIGVVGVAGLMIYSLATAPATLGMMFVGPGAQQGLQNDAGYGGMGPMA